MHTDTSEREEIFRQIRDLIDTYRLDCLWSTSPDYYPETDQETLKALDGIQRYGNVDAFRRAGKLREWVLRHSSAASA